MPIAKEINQDLDEYLHRRKSGKRDFSFKIRIGTKKEETVPDLKAKRVHVVYKKPSFWDRIFSSKEKDRLEQKEELEEAELARLEHDLSETDTELKQLRSEEVALERRRERQQQTFWQKINIFAKEKDELIDDIPVMEEKTLDPETIEVLKISSKWIARLPSDDKLAFKQSQDYKIYREYLDKWGLTKK